MVNRTPPLFFMHACVGFEAVVVTPAVAPCCCSCCYFVAAALTDTVVATGFHAVVLFRLFAIGF